MLMGPPATRKSTAIRLGSNILRQANYRLLAPDRMSRQSFLEEMFKINQPEHRFNVDPDDIDAVWDLPTTYAHEMTIHAGEFLDFIGQNDKDYLMLLTNLWDNPQYYSNPKVSKSSIQVTEPTINLVGGSTAENLNMAFPPNMMDSGTLSRFIFIHASLTGKKVLFPKPTSKEKAQGIVDWLVEIGNKVKGDAEFEDDAKELLHHIYEEAKPLDDPRFAHYSGRRITHLFKLCLLHAASRLSTTVSVRDVAQSHTVLMAAEHNMPQALGHFGRSKQSITQHAVLEYLESTGKPASLQTIYSVFSADFTRESDFQTMMFDLFQGGKIKMVDNLQTGIKEATTNPRKLPKWAQDLMIPDFLTDQELKIIGMTRET